MIGYIEWLIPAALIIIGIWKGPEAIKKGARALGLAGGEYKKAKKETKKELEEMEDDWEED